MSEYIKYFLNGYSQSLGIFPNYTTNNIEHDWVSIGLDIEISMNQYSKINKMDTNCQTIKEATQKIKK